MNYLLKLIPIDIKNYIFYFPSNIYKYLNFKYDNNTLPKKIICKTIKEIFNDKITKISIVIVTRNRLNSLQKNILPSIEKINFNKCKYEIIIVDNNSTDGTFDYLSKYVKNKITYKIYKEKRVSVSRARNKGIKNSAGELIVLVDDDCQVDTDWLNRIYNYYYQGNFLLGQGQIYDMIYKKNLIYDAPLIEMISGGNLSLRKKIFNFISFNEQISFFYEERDLLTQIQTFWPEAKYFIDNHSIRHYREPSIYRLGNGAYSDKYLNKTVKMFNLSLITKYILKRNLKIDCPLFFCKFLLKEIIFFPLELFCIKGDFVLLFETKNKMYKQLKYLRKYL